MRCGVKVLHCRRVCTISPAGEGHGRSLQQRKGRENCCRLTRELKQRPHFAPTTGKALLENALGCLAAISARVSLANASWPGAMASSRACMTGQSPAGSVGCLARKKSMTSPVVSSLEGRASWNPPFEPRREVTNPPRTSNCSTFAVSAEDTPVFPAISGDCIGSSVAARQHRHFSAVLSRIGKSNQITGFSPFDTDCPVCAIGILWSSPHYVVIGITESPMLS